MPRIRKLRIGYQRQLTYHLVWPSAQIVNGSVRIDDAHLPSWHTPVDSPAAVWAPGYPKRANNAALDFAYIQETSNNPLLPVNKSGKENSSLRVYLDADEGGKLVDVAVYNESTIDIVNLCERPIAGIKPTPMSQCTVPGNLRSNPGPLSVPR